MGKNQHYLPQFLLRRFSSRRAKDNSFIWLFRRGEEPSQPNVRNVGAASYFYSRDASGAEGLLSQLEDRYASLLREFEGGAGVPAGREAECIDFAAHLLVRTNNLRENAVEALDFTNRVAFKRAKNNPELESRLLARLTPELAASGMKHEDIVALVRRSISEHLPATIEALGGEERILSSFDWQGKAQAVQARVIETGFMARKATLGTLAWRLVPAETQILVLGDVGALAQPRLQTPIEPGMVFGSETHRRLIVPISPHTLLVGTIHGEADASLPEAAEINIASAELSRTFFVSSCNEEGERALHGRIGLRGDHLLSQARKELDA